MKAPTWSQSQCCSRNSGSRAGDNLQTGNPARVVAWPARSDEAEPSLSWETASSGCHGNHKYLKGTMFKIHVLTSQVHEMANFNDYKQHNSNYHSECNYSKQVWYLCFDLSKNYLYWPRHSLMSDYRGSINYHSWPHMDDSAIFPSRYFLSTIYGLSRWLSGFKFHRGCVETLPISFTPLCRYLSEETLKAVGPVYLVSTPGEVKYPTQWINV